MEWRGGCHAGTATRESHQRLGPPAQESTFRGNVVPVAVVYGTISSDDLAGETP